MRIVRAIVVIIMAFLFAFCDNGKDRAKVQFLHRQPDTTVITRLPLYDSLRVMVTSQLRLLFSAEVLKNESKRWNGSTVTFFVDSQNKLQFVDSSGIVKKQLSKPSEDTIILLVRKIQSQNIYSFVIMPDSAFEANFPPEYLEEFHLDIRKGLIWGNKSSRSGTEFHKDLKVGKGWIYSISYDKRGGW